MEKEIAVVMKTSIVEFEKLVAIMVSNGFKPKYETFRANEIVAKFFVETRYYMLMVKE